MSIRSIHLRLQGGYSRFLNKSDIEVAWRRGSSKLDLDLPLDLPGKRSQPLKLEFALEKRVHGKLPGGLRWRIDPELTLKARILFAGNAYLGNHRIPAGQTGILWSVRSRLDGDLSAAAGAGLLQIRPGSTFTYSWVGMVEPGETPLGLALEDSWRRFRNPLVAADVLKMEEGDLSQLSWRGSLKMGLEVPWSIAEIWQFPVALAPLSAAAGFSLDAGAGASFRVRQSGSFSLLVRKQGGLRLRLRREKERNRQRSLSAGLEAGSRVRLNRLGPAGKGIPNELARDLSAPARRTVNRLLRRAVMRKFGLVLKLNESRSRRNRLLLELRWRRPDGTDFVSAYGRALKGKIPRTEKGLRVSGSLEELRSRSLRLEFNVLNWLGAGWEHRRESREVVSVGPTGQLVMERTNSTERRTHTWEEVQFLKLLDRDRRAGTKTEHQVEWSYGRSGRFKRDRLKALLKLALETGMTDRIELPGPSRFPMRLEVLFLTRFTAEGLRTIRGAGEERWRQYLVRALELVDPRRYARNTHWRDWIVSPELRALVAADPVQAHLLTRYPLAGRSEIQRRQAVMAYRQVRRFLGLLEQWRRGSREALLETPLSGPDIPIFVFFHVASPPAVRRSIVVLTGDMQRLWGDRSLLAGRAE